LEGATTTSSFFLLFFEIGSALRRYSPVFLSSRTKSTLREKNGAVTCIASPNFKKNRVIGVLKMRNNISVVFGFKEKGDPILDKWYLQH